MKMKLECCRLGRCGGGMKGRGNYDSATEKPQRMSTPDQAIESYMHLFAHPTHESLPPSTCMWPRGKEEAMYGLFFVGCTQGCVGSLIENHQPSPGWEYCCNCWWMCRLVPWTVANSGTPTKSMQLLLRPRKSVLIISKVSWSQLLHWDKTKCPDQTTYMSWFQGT